MAKYNIGGYIFDDENSAKKAAKELKAVEYVIGQLKNADENGVLTVYKKLLNQRLFSTDIGMGFLNQLRQNLLDSGTFSPSDIPEVYSLDSDDDKSADDSQTTSESKDVVNRSVVPQKRDGYSHPDSKYNRLRVINSILLIISLTLLVCVCGMFYINSTINSPNILNYKESITNEFSSWKQELEQKEKELNDRERELDEREKSIGDIENN
ncbi:MAG: hypothetical protein K6D38_07085 [Pseudobutyrivibrio sp.]|nr:hypothetical protein [Pseudobutyrivibrio sp.]